ncbi:MAG: tetratricopeptide repeat protein [Anaerolinea sp.]|nr:tetratricopeptide repeat protein [Anaerolinea sp.]
MEQKPTTLTSELSRVWALHSSGRSADSLAQFEKLAAQYPDDLDVLYGLALAQKSAGLRESALNTFSKLAEAIEQQRSENPGSNRFQMLARMVQQRLSELGS